LSDNKTPTKQELQRLKEYQQKIRNREQQKKDNENVIYSARLSNDQWVEYNNDFEMVLKTKTDKGIKTRIIYKGQLSLIKQLCIEGKQYYEVMIPDTFIGNSKEIQRYMQEGGHVVGSANLSDCLNALFSDSSLPSIIGYPTTGVYLDNREKLILCLKPYPISDEQRRIDKAVEKAKTEILTKEKLQGYIDIVENWHPYEVLLSMAYGVMSPFAYILKTQFFLIPYIYHTSPATNLGKSLVAAIFSAKLFGIPLEGMSSVASAYRLADTLDSICGFKTIDEAQHYSWHGQYGDKIKQAACNALQDKRGTSNLSNRIYMSRLVPAFNGNGFPLTGRPELVRFYKVEFDHTKETGRTRENTSAVASNARKLKPIGFRIVEHELTDLKYSFDELITRITNYGDLIDKEYKEPFLDSRRPDAWGFVYEGLKAWERICNEYNVNWTAPTIDVFCREVVSKIESDTFGSAISAGSDFIDWLSEYTISKHGMNLLHP